MSNLTGSESYILDTLAKIQTDATGKVTEDGVRQIIKLAEQLDTARTFTNITLPLLAVSLTLGCFFGFFKSPILQSICHIITGFSLCLVPNILSLACGLSIATIAAVRIPYHLIEHKRAFNKSKEEAAREYVASVQKTTE